MDFNSRTQRGHTIAGEVDGHLRVRYRLLDDVRGTSPTPGRKPAPKKKPGWKALAAKPSVKPRSRTAAQRGYVPPELSPQTLLDQWLAAQGLDGSGSGGMGAADYQAQARLEAQLAAEAAKTEFARAKEMEKLRQQFEAQQEAKRLEEQRRAQLEELKQQRQATFVDLMGRDPVRAVMFAMGLGPEADQFNIAAKSLGQTLTPMAGAKQKETEHETALRGILGSGKFGTTAGAKADIGKSGVTGLGSVEQAARAFQQGGVGVQSLLSSAFGIGGAKAGEGGLTPEALMERVQAVTPKGIL